MELFAMYEVPGMFFLVNCCFAWFTVLLAIGGYVYLWKRTGKRWAFWPVLAAGWTMYGVSHSLVLGGVAMTEWYMTLLRILGYVLVVAALCTLVVDMKKLNSK